MLVVPGERLWAKNGGGRAAYAAASRWQVRQPPAGFGEGEQPQRNARLTLREVLQRTRRHEPGAPAVLDLGRLRRSNDHMLAVLYACLRVDAGRRRLNNTLKAQTTLDDVAHVLEARVAAGTADASELSELAPHQAAMRCSVTDAMAVWDAANNHFTRLTRLLPSQLDTLAIRFMPLEPNEVERLAQAHVMARLQARPSSAPNEAGAIDEFSNARVTYQQAVAAHELARSRVERVRAVREMAEAGFRFGAHGVLGFVEAVVAQHHERNGLLAREFKACMALYALYALALQLPEQFDLY